MPCPAPSAVRLRISRDISDVMFNLVDITTTLVSLYEAHSLNLLLPHIRRRDLYQSEHVTGGYGSRQPHRSTSSKPTNYTWKRQRRDAPKEALIVTILTQPATRPTGEAAVCP